MSIYNAIGIILRWKTYNYMLDIDVLSISLPNVLGVLKVVF